MPRISNKKKEKINEHILSVLFDNFPRPLFTAHISQEIARDEEFTKSLLKELSDKNIIIKINKNPKGLEYKRRSRWRLSNTTHNIYSNTK